MDSGDSGASGRVQWIERVGAPRLLVAVAALVALAALGVARLVGVGGDDGRQEVVTQRTTTTGAGPSDGDGDDRLADEGDPAVTTSTAAMSSATTSATAPTTTTTIASTTTTVCRNSTNPACGPFRWDPAPQADQPVVVTVTAPEQGVAGRPVTFTVEAVDTDAQVVFCEVYDLGDGTKQGVIGQRCDQGTAEGRCSNRYGPWTPPSRKGGRFQFSLTHTYAQPGTYTVRFFSYSEDGGTCHPYGSTKTTEVTFVVAAASGS